MSESEFAAAISPYLRGSSTTGVMKSVVRIPILSSVIFHSAASSPCVHEASSSSEWRTGSPFKISSSSAGAIFAAQPLVLARSVSLIYFASPAARR
ncbi:hypothetical protein JS73_09605 [Synergistes jonesii]|nr:hypothetical protein JS73_09605 [Synergistes jonesii]OFB61269.1 hypothetical protein JS72_11230 [Synergistes jonesii]OFB62027.1 hypothetical protein JS79_09745 [Synergistes jonesii]OFB67037.1 hypothetical protein JS78_09615 [Synergistes jonesii]OFB68473.1 hypothetical protein JS77_09625 [Synergistes jonesii]